MEEGAVWAQEVQVPDAAQCPWMKIARDPSVLTEPLPPKQEEKAWVVTVQTVLILLVEVDPAVGEAI